MSVRNNTIANFLGQGWRTLMGLAFIPIYIRYLGLEAYGLIGIFFVLQSWLGLLDMGIRPALGREMARYTAGALDSQQIRVLLRSTEWVVFGVALLLATLVWAASSWLASNWVVPEVLDRGTVRHAFGLMGIVVALSLIESVYVSSIAGLQRQIVQNCVGALVATIRAVGAVAVLWFFPQIEAFFLWQGLVSVLSISVFSAIVHGTIPPAPAPSHFSLSALKGMRRFAGGVATITFLALLLTQVDKVLLSRILSLSEFGRYSLSALVAGGLYALAIPITAAFYPRFIELATNGPDHELRSAYHLGAQLVSVFMGSAAITLIFFSEEIVILWTSDPLLTKQVGPLISVMAFGTLLNGLMWIPHQMQLAHGWTSLAIKTNLIAVAILIPVILWVAPRFGGVGVAWTWVALNIGYVLVSIYFFHRKLLRAEKWRWYAADVALPLFAAASSCVVFDLLIPEGSTKLAKLAFLTVCGSVTLLAAGVAAPQVRLGAITFLILRFRPPAIHSDTTDK